MRLYTKNKIRRRFIFVSLLFLFCFLLSFALGRYSIKPSKVAQIALSSIASTILGLKRTWTDADTILLYVRFPRVFMAGLIGAGLSCAGSAYQSIFQNPMVSPDVLGASAGAGFGAALGIYYGLGNCGIAVTAFMMGIFAVFIVLLISSRIRINQTLGLVLTGIMIGSLFTSSISFLKLIADPTSTLPEITYWLMGSLASMRTKDIMLSAPFIIAGMIPIFLLSWKINILTLGDEQAETIGVNARRVRFCVVLCATIITAACVAVSGIIGWVGLAIPHFSRILIGSDFRLSMPFSILLGGSFLLIVDNFARLLSTSEIPIGILTAFIGAPFFLYLIFKEGNKL